MVVLGGGAVSYERSTPVIDASQNSDLTLPHSFPVVRAPPLFLPRDARKRV